MGAAEAFQLSFSATRPIFDDVIEVNEQLTPGKALLDDASTFGEATVILSQEIDDLEQTLATSEAELKKLAELLDRINDSEFDNLFGVPVNAIQRHHDLAQESLDVFTRTEVAVFRCLEFILQTFDNAVPLQIGPSLENAFRECALENFWDGQMIERVTSELRESNLELFRVWAPHCLRLDDLELSDLEALADLMSTAECAS